MRYVNWNFALGSTNMISALFIYLFLNWEEIVKNIDSRHGALERFHITTTWKQLARRSRLLPEAGAWSYRAPRQVVTLSPYK